MIAPGINGFSWKPSDGYLMQFVGRRFGPELLAVAGGLIVWIGIGAHTRNREAWDAAIYLSLGVPALALITRRPQLAIERLGARGRVTVRVISVSSLDFCESLAAA